jgi:hypothetical protein
VQLGDAIAREARIDGFKMHATRKKVLYVDLVHSDLQFKRRYAYYPDGGSTAKHYKFSERFHRERPASLEEVADWVREKVSTGGFEVVIIDDLAAVRTTAESSRETTALMRGLRKICDEFGTSILAIMGAEAGPGRIVNEGDLRRNRGLCSIADSVFAMGRHPANHDTCIIQTRARYSRIFWTQQNAPICRVVRPDHSFVGMIFDERFRPVLSDEETASIRRVKTMRLSGATYRTISAELGITKSRAGRLLAKWTEDIGVDDDFPVTGSAATVVPSEFSSGQYTGGHAGVSALHRSTHDDLSVPGAVATGDLSSTRPPDDELEEWEECDFEKPVWLEEEEARDTSPARDDPPSDAEEIHTNEAPFGPFPLRRSRDGNGREIFVESEHLGQPTIWYRREPDGTVRRFKQGIYGPNSQIVNGEFLTDA